MNIVKRASLALMLLLVFLFACATAETVEFEHVSPFDVKSLWLMKQARSLIESYHVDAGKDKSEEELEDELVYGAIKGMVSAWGDPYTRFLDPDGLAEEEIGLEGQYGGVGMYIGERDGMVLVISPIEDTPAERAGLKPKDQIVKLDDEVAIGWHSDDIAKRLRGTPGTSISVWVRRESEDELLKFDLVREIIKIQSVKHEMLDDKIGYLRLTQFKKNTDTESRAAMREMLSKGAKGIVLDLRNNGGGLVDVAVNISSMFLSNGIVVETKGRVARANDRYDVDRTWNVATDIPLVVLINEGSASASEILAGAMMDRKRAITVGKKSFGKGSIQTLFPLTDGSAMFVTIARYYTPGGKMIDKVGLTPTIDVEGEMTKEHDKDEQLKRACEELKKKMGA